MDETDQPSPTEQPASQQYSLRTLLGVVTALALLFGVLTWLGLDGMGALVAFGAASGAALFAIACIEFVRRMRNLGQGPRR
jgi:hypothetical protein